MYGLINENSNTKSKKARVLVNNKNISSINYGMLLLVDFQNDVWF